MRQAQSFKMARPPPFPFSSSSSLANFTCPDNSEPQVIIDCDASYEELVVRRASSGRRDGLSGTADPPSSSSAAVHNYLPRDVTRPVARPASSCPSSSTSSSFSQAFTSRCLPSPSGEDDGEHEDDETTTSSSSAPDSDASAVRRSDRLARQPKPQYALSSSSSNLSIFFGFKAGAGTALAHKTSTKRRRVGRKRKLPAVLTPKEAQIDENIDPRKAEHPPPDKPFLFLWGSSQKDARPEPDWLPRVGKTSPLQYEGT